MIDDILVSARLALRLLSGAGAEARRAFVHGLVYLAMLLPLYFGWHVIGAGGNLPHAFRAAFLGGGHEDGWALSDQATRYGMELRAASVADRTINQVLQAVLVSNPTVARARVAIIHNGVLGLTGTPVLRFDISYAVASPGRDAGALVANRSMAEWVDFIPALLAGDCAWVPLSSVTSASMRERAATMRMREFMGCLIVDTFNRPLGGIFVSWDDNDPVPSEQERAVIAGRLKIAAAAIGVALTLQREAM